MRIRVAVQHQNACSVAVQGLHYTDKDNNQLYVNMVDNFYFIVHTKIKQVVLKEIRTSRGKKYRAEQISMVGTDPLDRLSLDHTDLLRSVFFFLWTF